MKTFDLRLPDRKEIGLATCGDWHLGAMTCDEDAVDDWIAKVHDNKWYVILMGDLMENATIGSVGAVFEQIKNPQSQLNLTIEKLTPIKEYIIGGVAGNHGRRSVKSVGLDPDEIICTQLGTKYWGPAALGRIQVGKAHWTIFVHHGHGGGALLGSKLNVIAERMTKIVPMADLYLAGHTHADVAGSDSRYELTTNSGAVRLARQHRHFSGTGSLLNYEGYPEAMLLPPASKVQVVHHLHTRVQISRGNAAGKPDGNMFEKPYQREPFYYF